MSFFLSILIAQPMSHFCRILKLTRTPIIHVYLIISKAFNYLVCNSTHLHYVTVCDLTINLGGNYFEDHKQFVHFY